MKTYKSRILVWIVGLITGFGLVTASLIMTVGFNTPEYPNASHSKLYFSRKLLPDHTFYPALMVAERARLFITPKEEKPAVLLQLADLRMKSAQELADKGEMWLAARTLYKAHLYLIQASELIKSQNNWSCASDLVTGLNNFNELCPGLKAQIKPSDASLFEQMQVENHVLSEQIASLLWSEH